MNWIKESLHKLLPISFDWELYKSKLNPYNYFNVDYSYQEMRILGYLGKTKLGNSETREDHNWDKEYRPKPRQTGCTDFVIDQILGQIKEKIFPQPDPIPIYGTPSYLKSRHRGYMNLSGNKTIDFPILYGMSNQRLSDHISALDFETQVRDFSKFYEPRKEAEPTDAFKNLWDKAYPRLSIDPVTRPVIISSIGGEYGKHFYDMWLKGSDAAVTLRGPLWDIEHSQDRVSWEPGFSNGKLVEMSMVPKGLSFNMNFEYIGLAESLRHAILKLKNKAEGDYPDW